MHAKLTIKSSKLLLFFIFLPFGQVRAESSRPAKAEQLVPAKAESFAPMRGESPKNDTLSVRQMDEVVVVSNAKEHSELREQPISATSIGATQLRQRDITGIKDLSANIPGLFIPNYGSRLTSSTYLRGVGSRIGTPAIGMYVDDIPLANMSSLDQDLSDADRIDVLRGPQATLYGRNTIGGLIRVYTKDPMKYQGTDLFLSGATYHNYRARATHYHRPSEHFAFSAGASYEHRGGFFDNIALGNYADRGDDLAARWRGVFVPSDKVRLDLSLRYQWTRQHAYPYSALEGEDAGQVAYNRDSHYYRHLLTAGLKAEHDLGRILLTSATGFQFLKDDMLMDQDFSRQDIYILQQNQNSKTLSEEVALRSKSNRHWQWTSGASIQYQWLATQGPVTFYQDGIDWLNQMTAEHAFASMPPILEMGVQALDGKPTQQGITFPTDFRSPVLTAGIFHQSTFPDLFGAKGLQLAIGWRLDYERLWLDYKAGYNMNQVFSFRGTDTTYPIQADLADKLATDYLKCLPRLSLQYRWGKTGNVYATVSRGYRSGGYNLQMFNELLQPLMRNDVLRATIDYLDGVTAMPERARESVKATLTDLITPNPDVEALVLYKPETAWNYELGSHLNFLDGRLQADLAAYWIETRDLQLSQMSESGMGRITVNADHSRSLGMEVALQGYITPHFSLSGAYGYTHATLRHSGTEEHPDDYFVPFAPQHTLSVGGRYVWDTRGWLQHIVLGVTGRGAGRIYWTRENDLSQRFYGLLDARVSFIHNGLEIGLWGKNLTKTDYSAFSFVTRSQVFRQQGNPLQAGLDLRVKM